MTLVLYAVETGPLRNPRDDALDAEQTVPDPWYAAANISWPLVLAGVLGFACLALSLLISSR